MKLPKGHIVKTSVKYNLKRNSLEEFVKETINEFDGFTGYLRILADKGEYEEEIKIILSEGEILGGSLKLPNTDKFLYGNECGFQDPFESQRCGVSVVRLNSDGIDMIKVSYPECIVLKVLEKEESQPIHNRDELLKKYRIKELSDAEIKNLLEKLNGD